MNRTTDMADALARQCRAVGLPDPVREYRFASPRRWRLDLVFLPQRLACEVDGGVFIGGRHTSGVGYTHDCEKLNAAVLLGWRVLRFTPAMVHDGTAVQTIERALEEQRD